MLTSSDSISVFLNCQIVSSIFLNELIFGNSFIFIVAFEVLLFLSEMSFIGNCLSTQVALFILVICKVFVGTFKLSSEEINIGIVLSSLNLEGIFVRCLLISERSSNLRENLVNSIQTSSEFRLHGDLNHIGQSHTEWFLLQLEESRSLIDRSSLCE